MSEHGDEQDPESGSQHKQASDPRPTLLGERCFGQGGGYAPQVEEPDERQHRSRGRDSRDRKCGGGLGDLDQDSDEEAVGDVYEVGEGCYHVAGEGAEEAQSEDRAREWHGDEIGEHPDR